MSPQENGIFQGFDPYSPLSLRQFVRALEYILDDGFRLSYLALRELGSTAEERGDRRASLQAITARMRTDTTFSDAIQGLIAAYYHDDCTLLAAAAALAMNEVNESGRAIGSHVAEPQILMPTQSTSVPTTLAPALTPRNLRHAPNLQHATNLQRGYHCWDDGSFDRSHAKVGEPDASKFTIKLPSRKIDRKEVGGYAIGKGTEYYFPNENGWRDDDGRIAPFDWNNTGHVKKLHQWREQVFRRRIGGVRPTRVSWLESEKQYVLRLIEEQLKTHRRPKFAKLANAFNRRFHGQRQRKGEKQVFMGKTNNHGLLQEDRSAPWRTASALSGQSIKWPELEIILRKRAQERLDAAGENQDVQVSSGDEPEEPCPIPQQTVFQPRKFKPYTRKDGTASNRNPLKAKPKAKTETLFSSTSTPAAKPCASKRKRADDSDEGEDLSDVSSDDLSDPYHSD